MDQEKIFKEYLQRQYEKAGAVTPAQKLDVVKRIIEETRRNPRVPTKDSVISLPADNEAVQAVLRGEQVAIGATSIASQGFQLTDVTTWPTWARLAVIVVIFALIALLVSRMTGRRGAPAPTPTVEPTPTVFLSPTPDWIATMTAIAPPPPPPPTLPPPPPTPTFTPTPAFMVGIGGPAENSRDPASVEIRGRVFVVSKGQVDKDGKWVPDGPQWLAGTEVRRVFAIPYDALADIVGEIGAGEMIYVRTRGGQVIKYRVRDVVRIMANQIESFFSLYPSIAISLPMKEGDVKSVERIVIFGEAEEDQAIAEGSAPHPSILPNAYTTADVNLRDNPGLKSNVLMGLPRGTPLIVINVPTVSVDGLTWVYVQSPYGFGWLASNYVQLAVTGSP
jgi:hypothetical protein